MARSKCSKDLYKSFLQEVGVKIFNLLNVPVKFTNDNLKIILEAFNVTLDDISPTEVGKNILD
ncbi:MAG: hypothetical protein O7C62_08615, partial [Rickettsia endosymbiont of Ixodes persulcatus]|nr:hypothetical protein [Rickettsia endosymbiont of Ixodes persulcatus]